MQISDKIGIAGLVFVAIGGGYALLRNFVSHRRSVAEERCGKCHADSKRDIDTTIMVDKNKVVTLYLNTNAAASGMICQLFNIIQVR